MEERKRISGIKVMWIVVIVGILLTAIILYFMDKSNDQINNKRIPELEESTR